VTSSAMSGEFDASMQGADLNTSGASQWRQGRYPQVASVPAASSPFGCPAPLQLASLLASLALTTTASDPEHGALREAAFAAARDFHAQQAASALAAERSLAAVPLVDVYSLGGCVYLACTFSGDNRSMTCPNTILWCRYDYGPMDDVIDPASVHATPDSLLVPQVSILFYIPCLV
jgi:hypothetical protein